MILLKLLGIFDILAGILFWIYGIFSFIPLTVITFFGIVILIKGIGFSIAPPNFASILDIIFGLIIIFGATMSLPKWAIIITSIFLIQKGIFSWF